MELKLNEQYEFEVIDICSNANGYDYLLVLGPDDKTYKVYNIIKFQLTNTPDKINGIVVGFDINGKAKIRQDECQVLREHYDLGHYYAFNISDKKRDNNDKQYYVLEDDFSYQRWYSNEEFEIGDDLILLAKSYTNNGYIYYEQHHTHLDVQTPDAKPAAQPASIPEDNVPVFDGDEESGKVEYKTSIVFTPKNELDIDVQMFNIVRELAAFMNAEGGTLYIGIHDKTKQVVGIDKDLPHLCEGESPYAASYTPDYDHYQLKIRDTLVSFCSAMAGSLINVSFPQQDGVTYCKIDVKAANWPIWTKGNMLFQRQGNQAQMLRGEAITQFVGEKTGRYVVAKVGGADSKEMSPEQIASLIRDAVKKAINDRRLEVAAPAVPVINEPKYWIVWFVDGTWSKMRAKSNAQNVFLQIPVNEDAADLVIAFCHKGGTINKVELKVFIKKTKLGQTKKDGFNTKEPPTAIYICHPSSLIAVHSADQGGTEYIKLHHLTDFNSTTSGKNQGSFIIPKEKGHVLEFKLVSTEKKPLLEKLIYPKKATSQSFGSNWNDINIQQEISIFNSL